MAVFGLATVSAKMARVAGPDQRLDLMQVVDVLDEISVDAELRQEVAERID